MGFIADRLEKYLRDSLRVRHIVLTGMGRSAITAGLKAMGISKGDEVIIPAFICPAVERAVRKSGATPVYADIGGNSFNLTVEGVERVLSNRCRAVLVSHTYGYPADAKRFRELCDKTGLFLIEDCVSSFERYCIDRNSQIYGDIAIFSIYKAVVNTGGGFVATNDDGLALLCRRELEKLMKDTEKATLFQEAYSAVHNLFSSLYEVYGIRPPFYSAIVKRLRDFHMKQANTDDSGGEKKIVISKLSCLSAYLQMPLLRRQVRKRLKTGGVLAKTLGGLKGVRLLNGDVHLYKVLPVVIEKGRREDFIAAANRSGLNVMRPWFPLFKFKETSFLSDNLALLPVGPYLSEGKVSRLREILLTFGATYE